MIFKTRSEHCLCDGHEMVVYDRNPEAVKAYVAEGDVGAAAMEDLVRGGTPAKSDVADAARGTITEDAIT